MVVVTEYEFDAARLARGRRPRPGRDRGRGRHRRRRLVAAPARARPAASCSTDRPARASRRIILEGDARAVHARRRRVRVQLGGVIASELGSPAPQRARRARRRFVISISDSPRWMPASTAASTRSICAGALQAGLELRARRDHDPVVVGQHHVARASRARRRTGSARRRAARRRCAPPSAPSRAPTAAARAAARCDRARSRRRRSRPARGARPRSPAARRARPAAPRRPARPARRRARPRRSPTAPTGTRPPPRPCTPARRSARSPSAAGSRDRRPGSDLSTSQSVLTGTAARASMRAEPSLGAGMRVIAGTYGGRHPEGPAGREHAPDVGPGARGAVLDPGRRGRRTRACSTCSPAPARSGSRRSHAAPHNVTFVDDDRAAIAAIKST